MVLLQKENLNQEKILDIDIIIKYNIYIKVTADKSSNKNSSYSQNLKLASSHILQTCAKDRAQLGTQELYKKQQENNEKSKKQPRLE